MYDEVNETEDIFQVPTQTFSITHVVKKLQNSEDIICHFGLPRIAETIDRNQYIVFDKGKLLKKSTSDVMHNYEIMLFHFIRLKKQVSFAFPDWNNVADKFYYDRFGFYTDLYQKPNGLKECLFDITTILLKIKNKILRFL